nr:SDR family NAD(P)-dependent oxidoreductase [Verrucomicrobium spinosum]
MYAATKSYVSSLSEALAIEFASKHIRVLYVCPGPTPTNFGQNARRADDRDIDAVARTSWSSRPTAWSPPLWVAWLRTKSASSPESAFAWQRWFLNSFPSSSSDSF